MIESHLEELEALMLRGATDLPRQLRQAADQYDDIFRKANARVRAIRRDQDVACARGEDGRCSTHCPEN